MSHRATDSQQRYRVRSLGRALDLIDLLAARGKDGARLTDLARELRCSKAAAYAILQTLLARNLASDVGQGAGRRYRLGMGLAALGDRAIANVSLAELAMPEMRALTEEIGLTTRLAILEKGYAIVVARVDGPGVVRFDAALGRQEMLHCTAVGKAMLAAMPIDQAREILQSRGLQRRTAKTRTKVADLLREFALIQENGYAIDDEEDTEGVVCVGSCIFGRGGEALGAVSVTSLKSRDWPARQARLGARVVGAARAISRLVGGPDKANSHPQNDDRSLRRRAARA